MSEGAGSLTPGEPRAFDVGAFERERDRRGLRWGAPLTYAAETGSTNDDALLAARNGAPHGSLFLADHQHRGRGRRGRGWYSAPNHNLLFSVLLRPLGAPSAETAAAPTSALTLAVGLGVRAALAPYAAMPLRVKWPNDVLAGSRKLAGVLCEGQLAAGKLEVLVIGVGINVHQREFPPGLDPEPLSLTLLAAAPEVAGGADRGASGPDALAHPALQREAVLARVLEAVEERVSACLASGFAGLIQEFSEHDGLYGAAVEVSGASPLQGTARGVDAEGALLVEQQGVLVRVHSGTVRVMRR